MAGIQSVTFVWLFIVLLATFKIKECTLTTLHLGFLDDVRDRTTHHKRTKRRGREEQTEWTWEYILEGKGSWTWEEILAGKDRLPWKQVEAARKAEAASKGA